MAHITIFFVPSSLECLRGGHPPWVLCEYEKDVSAWVSAPEQYAYGYANYPIRWMPMSVCQALGR